MTSPTQRTLALLKKEGYLSQVVERFNPYACVRVDLFGCIDVLAIREKEILGVQTTSGSNVSSRVTKALSLPAIKLWLLAGGKFSVWGWSLKGKRGKRKTWQVRKVNITLEDFDE